ncbi:purine nucleoside phosphorylase YfiH [Tatumella sp. JGM118]|uniref:purine nucleoside phosphorylase YfiH n=1 Tax=Tatumella sp. JGM118 TaxID=2799796 RepID=UPI001BAFFAFC|nr:purine nucleoside phosphorylase YfiH [Tatumella sp. JGM118]MBS0910481.1 polyphenol oxidase [Tatumella sp. JGM118]
MSSLIIPEWPAPANVRACSTTRIGGVSQPPYDSLNLGAHVADDPAHVRQNRHLLCDLAGLPAMPLWLNQVHGTDVVTLPQARGGGPQADACYTRAEGQVCAVMTADCLPVIFCSRDGREVAAAHAGWRGLCGGVLESTLATFRSPPEDILVWLGPAIGPQAFEVGPEVRDTFIAHDPAAAEAFIPVEQKYLADLWMLARQRLSRAGVIAVYGGGRCTYSEPGAFFSYRRESVTGRMATLVWLV